MTDGGYGGYGSWGGYGGWGSYGGYSSYGMGYGGWGSGYYAMMGRGFGSRYHAADIIANANWS